MAQRLKGSVLVLQAAFADNNIAKSSSVWLHLFLDNN